MKQKEEERKQEEDETEKARLAAAVPSKGFSLSFMNRAAEAVQESLKGLAITMRGIVELVYWDKVNA